ncbi:MAG: hypothetical protein ACHRXM_30415 [Isosphaerales bacterium]
MQWLLILVFGVVIVVGNIACYFWLRPRVVRHLPAERIPGWALPIAMPLILVLLLRLRTGLRNQLVTPGNYVFMAILGVVLGLLLWMARRQKSARAAATIEKMMSE